MLVALIAFALAVLPLARSATDMAPEDAQQDQQRKLASTIEDLRKVAKDSPLCGSGRGFGFGDSRRFSREFSDNVQKYRTSLSPRAAGDLHGYSSGYFWYHMWSWGEFRYTAENNAFFDTIGEPMRIVLGFVENYAPNCATGKRVFSATVNGEPFFTDLDVYDTVGCNTVLIIAKDFLTDGSGKIDIKFTSSVQNPMVSIVDIRNRIGCNDPCPCWTPELVAEYPVKRVSVVGTRTGSQSLKAFTSNNDFEISKAPTNGVLEFKCTPGKTSAPKIPLSAQQADSCREILRPAVDEYYKRMTDTLTAIPLSEYCHCWGSRNTARDTERTSCSATERGFSWINYGRNFYSAADADVSLIIAYPTTSTYPQPKNPVLQDRYW